jgi:hypothetical protein
LSVELLFGRQLREECDDDANTDHLFIFLGGKKVFGMEPRTTIVVIILCVPSENVLTEDGKLLCWRLAILFTTCGDFYHQW